MSCIAAMLLFLPPQASTAAEAAPQVEQGSARPEQTSEASNPSLRQRMADPTWFARSPSLPWWSLDGQALYYTRPVEGEGEPEQFRFDLATRSETSIGDDARHTVAPRNPSYALDRTRAVYTRAGDLFVYTRGTDVERQLTRTSASEVDARFLAAGDAIMYRQGEQWFTRELTDGFTVELPSIRFEEDPADDEEELDGYLEEQQARVMEVLAARRARREARAERERERAQLDPLRAPQPIYVVPDLEAIDTLPSPDARRMLVSAAEEASESTRDSMPAYVTESSYVETSDVRPHVGIAERRAERLFLIDLEQRDWVELDLSTLPGIEDDLLAQYAQEPPDAERGEAVLDADETPTADDVEVVETEGAEAEPAAIEPAEVVAGESGEQADREQPKRGVALRRVRWSPEGELLVAELRSLDNKDRWIVQVDLEDGALRTIEHLRDPAWIGWNFNEMEWLHDGSAFWFLSEASGYSQLRIWAPGDDESRALTNGAFEISKVTQLPGRAELVVRANREHPGVHEIYRVALPTGEVTPLTALEGRSDPVLSPSGEHLALLHSKALTPDDLWLLELQAGAAPERLFDSTTDAFRAVDWTEPEIVAVPSRHGRPIWSRVYEPRHSSVAASAAARPAVVFAHGAGYSQNAHFGWSGYFREFFFHDLLARRGVVVLDMDYRASAGYGRDWRTAIYREMGTPELEDLEDGVAYLVAERNVDPKRVGVYGGSYGGFMALMALFKRPGLFAAGAALRPVTDWAHYNDGYTRNILDTPEIDPGPFERSSPIEFAAGLEDALLICHGMLDNNVLAKDSIRLAQRLIELEKDDWELALYPLEPHGFREPSSWRDEYSRILRLFEEHLELPGAPR